MDIASLLSNLGGEGLTPQERKRAVAFGLLNLGAGTLANNTGNYGQFGPAFGRGMTQGLLGYQAQLGREEAGAQARARKAAQAKLFQDSIRPDIPAVAPQAEMPAQYKVGDMSFNTQQEAENYILGQGVDKQGLGAAMYGEMGGTKQLPEGTDFGQYLMPPYMPMALDPKMQVNTVPGRPGKPGNPGQRGGFDKNAFIMGALQNPDAGYTDMALKTLFENGGKDTPYGKIMPSDFTPASLAKYDKTRDFNDLVPNGTSVYGKYNPGQYSPESWAAFTQTGDPSVLERWVNPQVINAGGTQEVIGLSGNRPRTLGSIPVTPKPTDMPSFQAAQEVAKGQAKTQVEREGDAPKIQAKIASQAAKFKNLEQTIDQAIKNSGFWSTGIMAQMTKGLGGSPAKNLASTLNTVKANMGFDELQEMRDNSPTGGALGQVAVQEIAFLQSVIASLEQEQSNEQLKNNLKIIKEAKRQSNQRIREAYQETYGKGTQSKKPAIDSLW